MAQQLASLLLRRSSSTLFSFPASSHSTSPSLSSNSPSTSALPDLWLEDGETRADLQSLLSPDLSTSLRYLLTLLSTPSSTSKLALRVANFLLNPPRPTTLPSSSTSSSSSSSRTPRTKPESTRTVVALLLGITSVLSRSHSHEEDEKDLEDLSECLVGIFVKGGGKSPELDEDVAVAILGGTTGVKEGFRSTWELSREVSERLDLRTVDMQQSDDSVEEEQVRVRTRINSTYLLALLSSPSSSSSKQPTSVSTPLSASETLFARCIELGLSISLVGASASTTTSSDDDPHSSHADSLVWKSRKRLELSGHSSLAVIGLPSDGGYAKWDGGAVERARLEQARRDKMVAGEERSGFRSGIRLGRLGDGTAVLRSEGGDLLDAPRRLKGKKIVAQRRGTFTRSSLSSSQSSSGPTTPTDEPASLQYAECSIPHHSHAPTSPNSHSSSTRPPQPTTSLPSLNAKPSIHLLRLTASPPRSDSSLPRDHRTDPPPLSPEALKSSTPIPLPHLLNQNGIFSPAQASIESPVVEGVDTESVFDRGSRLLRRSVSRLALTFTWTDPTPPPPLPTPSSTSSTSSPPPSPSSSTSTTPGRPSSIWISSFGQTSVSSGSSTSSSPTSPILISEVPKIAFQPSSYRYDCLDGKQNQQPSSNIGGVWRPSSPRGDRVRVVGSGKRGRKDI